MPKVSVILTSYNHGDKISQTIDGVLNQSFGDFELIIWDDASTDDSWEIINSYSDNRIKKFRNTTNLRGVWGMNKAIQDVVNGEYIAIHHSGDNWDIDKLKKQVSYLDNNSDIDVVFTHVSVVNGDNEPIHDKNHFYYSVFNQKNRDSNGWMTFLLTQGNALCHPSVMLRKRCYDESGVYKYGLAQTADFEMWLRLSKRFKFYILEEKLTIFTIEDDDKNTSAHNKESETRSYYECYRIISDFVRSLTVNEMSSLLKLPNNYTLHCENEAKYDFAMWLLSFNSMPPAKVVALDLLFRLLQDVEFTNWLKQNRNFDYHEFVKLSYEQDPFNVKRKIEYETDINHLASIIAEIEQNVLKKLKKEILDIDLMYKNSLSWKVTKPFRFGRRILSNPRAYAFGLKSKIKETPLEPILRKFYYGYLKFKRVINTTPYSKQNLPAIQSMSLKRRQVLCSDQHKHSFVNDIASVDLPEIDLTIVTYNNGQWLDKFLQSLLSQNYPIHKLNLHFVDNSSTNNTVEQLLSAKEVLASKFAGFSVYQRENLGFGAGHDYAVNQSQNELFLVTNIDLEFAPNSIVNVVKMAVTDEDTVASWELRQLPYEHPKYYDPVTLETNWSSHACILIRRSAYVEVGGYEERIFMYGEDVELSYRFRSYGYSLKYVPSAFVYHYTYDEANQVKPIQFSGSTLANAYLRLRYGNTTDKLIGLVLQVALLLRGGGFEGSRRLVLNNLKLIVKNASYFVSTQKKDTQACFPFRYFDYELVRDGAFYELNNPQSTDEQPLVTIITRTYQGRGFWLRECMASVINQTYSNIQHIIVEDGGDTHSSLVSKAKQSYGPSYNVEFYGFEKMGRSYTGNQGLARAQGQYCLFLDDDDLIFPDHIEVLVNELRNTSGVSAVYSLAWDVHTQVDKEVPCYKESVFETLPLFYQEFDYPTLLDHNYIPIQSILFKRSLYDKHGGFEEDMDQLEDWNLWTRYASETQFKFVGKTTSLFRTPAEQVERLRRARVLNAAFSDAVKRQKI